MRPDERATMERLEAALAAAGAVARRRPDARPDVSFAADLRSELLSELPPVPHAPPSHVRWSFGDLFRGRRMASALAVGLLAVAVGAAARTFVVGDGTGGPTATAAPTPTASPTATARPVVIGDPDGRVVETPTPTPSPTPSPTASPTPTPTPTPTPSPTPTPTPSPTPKPTAKPTPTPTAAPTPVIGPIELGLNGCNGGVVLDWTKVTDGRFHHYRTLRSGAANMAGAVELPATKTSDAGVLGAADASGTPGTMYFYRTEALDAGGSVIATSSVESAKSKPVTSMNLSATPADPGTTKFAWSKYGGPGACFTYYKLAYSETNPSPSYLAGDPTWAVISDQHASETTVAGPVSGKTYFVRMQAIRSTPLGAFVVGQSDVISYTAP